MCWISARFCVPGFVPQRPSRPSCQTARCDNSNFREWGFCSNGNNKKQDNRSGNNDDSGNNCRSNQNHNNQNHNCDNNNNGRNTSQRPSQRALKSTDPCPIHPNGNHTRGECFQNANCPNRPDANRGRRNNDDGEFVLPETTEILERETTTLEIATTTLTMMSRVNKMMTMATTETRNKQTITIANHAMHHNPLMTHFMLIVLSTTNAVLTIRNSSPQTMNQQRKNLTLTWRQPPLLSQNVSTMITKASVTTKHHLTQDQQTTW